MKKNIVARILLSPFSMLYLGLISLRNLFYEMGILKAISFNLPVINVGNLSIGGTGKTPHIEYLINLLSPYIDVATLSRGYKRQSKGFQWVQVYDNAASRGDEPMQFKRKFPTVPVAVSESRNIGIPMILKQYPDTKAILLDDAFQHRSVIPGLNILLTEFDNLFVDDYIMPAGRLREPKGAYERADIIVVSKSPENLLLQERLEIVEKIKPFPHQKVFFSKYRYGDPYYIFDRQITLPLDESTRIVLISAIASVDYLLSYLDSIAIVENIIKYEDHHYFSSFELEQFKKIYDNITTENTVFLTTEKDAMRLQLHEEYIQAYNIPIFVLPVDVEFLDEDQYAFDESVKQFLLSFKV
jgi:tetraacyldisaccharide 4'-kinase